MLLLQGSCFNLDQLIDSHEFESEDADSAKNAIETSRTYCFEF